MFELHVRDDFQQRRQDFVFDGIFLQQCREVSGERERDFFSALIARFSVTFRHAHFCLLFYDLTNILSFQDLYSHTNWLHLLHTHKPDLLPCQQNHPFNMSRTILIGNKSDLVDQRVVDLEEVMELTQKVKCPYLEISVKSSDNMGELSCNNA